jgi:hypothetical protein
VSTETEIDWEAFGRAVMENWPYGDVDGGDLQDLAEQHGLIRRVPGGFDPDVHEDELGMADPGDSWFVLAYQVKPHE